MTLCKSSSLSHIWKHNIDHDCGAISAFRPGFTLDDKMKRTASLLAKLMTFGYSVTKLTGLYPENGVPKKETAFWVVDQNDTGTLFDTLAKHGEDFEQESILFAPKGSVNNKGAKAFLFGIIGDETRWFKKGQKIVFNRGKFGPESPIYTSYVNDRPFIFEEVDPSPVPSPGTGFGNWGMAIAAKKHWSEL